MKFQTAPRAALMVVSTQGLYAAIQQHTLEWMSPSEVARYQRIRKQPRQQEFIASRCLLRILLAQALCCDWRSIVLEAPEDGAPVFFASSLTQEGFYLGLTHSHELIAGVVCNVSIGIDMEPCHAPRQRNTKKLIDFCCSPAEKKWLDALEISEVEESFLRLWTIKEAYFKKIGSGLDLSRLPDICTRSHPSQRSCENFHIDNFFIFFEDEKFILSICSEKNAMDLKLESIDIFNGMSLHTQSSQTIVVHPRPDPPPAAHAAAS